MKPFLILVACLAAGSVVGLGFAFREAAGTNHFGPITDPSLSWKSESLVEGGPKAVVEGGKVHEFGRMELNSTGKYTFVIRNVGEAPLRLTKEGTTCKCTLSELEKGEVAPGETVEVTLEWHPFKYAEVFSQMATLGSNDPENPTIELRITGSVVQALVLEPNSFRVTNLSAGETRTLQAKFLSYKEDDVEITSMQATGEEADHFQFDHRPLTSDELAEHEGALTGYAITMVVQPGLPLGTHRNPIVIESTSRLLPTYEAEVTADVVGDITIVALKTYREDRNTLYLGRLKQGSGLQTKIFLIVKGPHRDTVSFEAGSATPDKIQISIGKPESINNGRVRKFPVGVTIPADTPTMNYLGPKREELGSIRLRVKGHPNIEEVDLGVNFAVE